MMRFFVTLMLLTLGFPASAQKPSEFFLRDGDRVVFLGDSNTFAGTYVQYIEAYLFTRFPDKKFEVINLGLPSETVSGLSEPDHPYPRPNLHERLDRALAMTKPTVVVACYGMNDGIYYPFSEERFAKFKDGITLLKDKVKKAGARLTLMTPPPFDPLPVKDKVLPDGAPKYSWVAPYAKYDDVLSRYSEWETGLHSEGVRVVDLREAILAALNSARNAIPTFHYADDGVHLNAAGHWLIAQILLTAWNAPASRELAELDFAAGKAIKGKISGVVADKGELRFDWEISIPAPSPPPAQQLGFDIHAGPDSLRLIVHNAPMERYILFDGNRNMGEARREELEKGVETMNFRDISLLKRSAEILELVKQRERLLGLAWLTAVGYKRPNTPQGIPLEEAKGQASELEKRIRALAQPTTISLRLVPFAP